MLVTINIGMVQTLGYIWQICCSENGGQNWIIKLYNYLVIILTVLTLYVKAPEEKQI
jgi:hypothetical protein